MSGEFTLYEPGCKVPATLVAGSGGAYPDEGDGVEISGENANHPEVEDVTSAGGFVGMMTDLPPNFDDPGDLSDGDVIGEVSVKLNHAVDWLPENDATLSAGDAVVYPDSDGVVAADLTGTSPAHTPDQVVGYVWMTNQKDDGTGGKVAVVRSGR